MSDNLVHKFRPLLTRLPAIANLVLVVAIGLTAARVFWLLWPVEAAEAPAPAADTTGSDDADRAQVDIGEITAVDLFGKPDPSDTESQEVIEAPETRLDLTLTGIVSSDAGRSRALIKDDQGEQQPYAAGDQIADNVALHEIYATRVILDRGGRYETLTLERLKEGNAVQRVERGSSNNGSLPDDIGETLNDVRNEILQQPSRITQYMRLQPEKQDGSLVGYRIYPGRDRTLFQELGLQPGALVTQVNGTTLKNPQQAMQSLNELAQAPSVSVTLKHGGEERTMSVNFE